METPDIPECHGSVLSLSDVPIRNGNTWTEAVQIIGDQLSDVPIRNGNRALVADCFWSPFLSDVPIRNGNKDMVLEIKEQGHFGCPYKEWKPK